MQRQRNSLPLHHAPHGPPPRSGEDISRHATQVPPRNGEGDRPQDGGGEGQSDVYKRAACPTPSAQTQCGLSAVPPAGPTLPTRPILPGKSETAYYFRRMY